MSEIKPGIARVRDALQALAIASQMTEHGPVRSLAEAAAAIGVTPHQVVKSLVVRRGAGDHLFVLVPGDREISWPKLRAHLGVSRLSMPSAAEALEVTGFERGTITPLGSVQTLPVIADLTVIGQISLGAGAHGVGVLVDADEFLDAIGADRADVTDLS